MKVYYFFDFKNDIEKDKLKKNIVYFGDEFYFYRQVRKLLKDFAIRNSVEYEICYLDEMELAKGLERAFSRSFFSSKRMVVFRNPHKVKFSSKEKKMLLDAIKGDNFIVFEYPFGYNIFEKGNRKNLENFLIDNFTVYNLKKLNEYHAFKKVAEDLKRKKVKISDNCLSYIVKRYDCDLNRIFQTIENFLLYSINDDKRPVVITLKDIEPFLFYGSDYTPSQLVESILNKDIKKVFEILSVVQNDISFLMSVMGLLSWYFQKFFFYITMVEKGEEISQIRRKLKMSERSFNDLVEKSKNFSILEVKRFLKSVKKLDELFKSGSKIKDVIFQKIIFQLLFFDVEYKR